MPRDVSTHWHSTYDMLEFAIPYRDAIDSVTGNRTMYTRPHVHIYHQFPHPELHRSANQSDSKVLLTKTNEIRHLSATSHHFSRASSYLVKS